MLQVICLKLTRFVLENECKNRSEKSKHFVQHFLYFDGLNRMGISLFFVSTMSLQTDFSLNMSCVEKDLSQVFFLGRTLEVFAEYFFATFFFIHIFILGFNDTSTESISCLN